MINAGLADQTAWVIWITKSPRALGRLRGSARFPSNSRIEGRFPSHTDVMPLTREGFAGAYQEWRTGTSVAGVRKSYCENLLILHRAEPVDSGNARACHVGCLRTPRARRGHG
jgi:hypothetical protein